MKIKERSFEFTVGIVRLSKQLSGDRTSPTIADQQLGPGTSIRANIEQANK